MGDRIFWSSFRSNWTKCFLTNSRNCQNGTFVDFILSSDGILGIWLFMSRHTYTYLLLMLLVSQDIPNESPFNKCNSMEWRGNTQIVLNKMPNKSNQLISNLVKMKKQFTNKRPTHVYQTKIKRKWIRMRIPFPMQSKEPADGKLCKRWNDDKT